MTENYQAIHFFDHPIEALFDTPPAREKSPDCPNGFVWEDKTYRVIEMLSSWSDFTRRGKMARNMRPAHAAVASSRGSLISRSEHATARRPWPRPFAIAAVAWARERASTRVRPSVPVRTSFFDVATSTALLTRQLIEHRK